MATRIPNGNGEIVIVIAMAIVIFIVKVQTALQNFNTFDSRGLEGLKQPMIASL